MKYEKTATTFWLPALALRALAEHTSAEEVRYYLRGVRIERE